LNLEGMVTMNLSQPTTILNWISRQGRVHQMNYGLTDWLILASDIRLRQLSHFSQIEAIEFSTTSQKLDCQLSWFPRYSANRWNASIRHGWQNKNIYFCWRQLQLEQRE
jgi:hypothetical protein